MKTLGVAYGFRRGKWIKHSTDDLVARLRLAFKSRDVEVVKIGLLDSRVEIRNNKLVLRDAKTKRSYKDLDAIYIANWRLAPEIALALVKYLKSHNKAIINDEISNYPALTKLGEMVLMSNKGIPMPDSFFVRDKYLRKMLKNRQLPLGFKFPIIVKSIVGSMGANNWLVKDFEELAEILKVDSEVMLVVQEFIPNDYDYRILVFGGVVRAVIKRSRLDKNLSHLNNTSVGASGEMIDPKEFPIYLKQIALDAAEATKRSSLAGVDIIINNKTNKAYVLEVNKSPQIETGSNIDKKAKIFTDYVMEMIDHEK